MSKIQIVFTLIVLGINVSVMANVPPQTLFQTATDVKRSLAEARDLPTVLQIADKWDTAFRDHISKRKIEHQFSERDRITEYFYGKLQGKLEDVLMEKLAPELAKRLGSLAAKIPHLVSVSWAALEVSAPTEVRSSAGELLDLDRGVQTQIQAKLRLLFPPKVLSVVSSVNHEFAKDRASLSALPPRNSGSGAARPSRVNTDIDCSILQDPVRSSALLRSDPDAWQHLVEACEHQTAAKTRP